jgi:hypothetical protein
MPDNGAYGNRRPRLLDLFCGAGGAAVGYHRAGFDVVGVDLVDQPRYPFTFIREDALAVLRLVADGFGGYDAVHASPPCQHYANVTRWRGDVDDHPDLIGEVHERFMSLPVPWIIENVRTVELFADLMLCGSQFGLPVRRHRYFRCSFSVPVLVEPCSHRASDHSFDHGAKQTEAVYRDAMGCGWMTVAESREAIPPAYTEWIGARLLAHLGAADGTG